MDITLWLIAALSLTWFMSYVRASLSTLTLHNLVVIQILD